VSDFTDRYTSRKFLLACVFTGAAIMGLMAGKLSGGEFVMLAGTVLGLYGAADVAQDKFRQDAAK